MKTKKACVVLPTYNEAENIRIVIESIFLQQEKIATHELHVLVVDDNSPDGTGEKVRGLMKSYPNLHILEGEKKGLGEAYKRGMNHAIELLQPDLILQMDADLQHDVTLIPLFVQLSQFGFSLIIGSRFAPGGSTPNFSFKRKMISVLGNWLIRLLGGIPRIKDCTSGFRCIKANLIPLCNFNGLSSTGYSFQSSLLYELLRNKARVVEIPIVFPDRKHGQSKLSFIDQVDFLINILKIRFKNSREFIGFCIVGGTGVFVNIGVYYVLSRFMAVPFEIASPIAIETSILWNFMLNNVWTFQNRSVKSGLITRLAQFHTVSGLAGLLNYAVFLFLIHMFHVWDIYANLAGIFCGVIINYSMNSLWTWKEPGRQKI